MQPKILVVDDDPGVIRLVSKALERGRYAVDSALDGMPALDLATKNDYSLIISDIVMPQMSGFKFYESLKKIKPDTPIILMTGYSDFDYAVKALNMGALAFLVKPFDNSELLKWVDRVINLQKERNAYSLLFGDSSENIHEVAIDTATMMKESNLQNVAYYISNKCVAGRDFEKVQRMKIELAIIEALHNSLQHGNLELSSSLKPESLESDAQDIYQKLMKERLDDPKYGGRKIFIRHSRTKEKLELKIRDEGEGFDYRSILKNHNNLELPHGRGLILIKSAADYVSFNEAGNEISIGWVYNRN